MLHCVTFLQPTKKLAVHGLSQHCSLLWNLLHMLKLKMAGKGGSLFGQILRSLRGFIKNILLWTFFEVDVVTIEQFGVLGRVGVPFLHEIKFNNIIRSNKAKHEVGIELR